jgi:hypothetical protein
LAPVCRLENLFKNYPLAHVGSVSAQFLPSPLLKNFRYDKDGHVNWVTFNNMSRDSHMTLNVEQVCEKNASSSSALLSSFPVAGSEVDLVALGPVLRQYSFLELAKPDLSWVVCKRKRAGLKNRPQEPILRS